MDEGLILRFLTKTATSDDLRIVDEWVTKQPENMRQLFEMEQMWGLKTELKYADPTEIGKAYMSFREKVEQQQSIRVEKRKRRRMVGLYTTVAVAAVALVLVIMNVYKTFESESIIHNLSENIDVNEIEVPYGQNTTIKLADGTKVWLNSGSRLVYPARFSVKNRAVKLEGEGFFEVEHNKKSPFIVMSGSVSTTVLGTKFNVKAYEKECVRIALLEGIIEVSTSYNDEKIRLSEPDQQVEVSNSGVVTQKKVNAHAVSQWTQGEFYFENETLESIAATLERKFNVTISIQNEDYKQMVFYSRIKSGSSLEEILTMLKGTRNIDYSISDKNVYIY